MSRQSGTLGGTCRPPHRFKVSWLPNRHPFARSVSEATGSGAGRSGSFRTGWSPSSSLSCWPMPPSSASPPARSPSMPTICGCSPGCWPARATVELTRRVGENAGMVKDVYATWELPAALLLPLGLRAAAAHRPLGLTQWRILKAPPVPAGVQRGRVGLSYVAAALTFHGLIRLAPGAAAHPASHALAWMLCRRGLRGGAVDDQPDPDLDRDQGLRPGGAVPRRAVRPATPCTTT